MDVLRPYVYWVCEDCKTYLFLGENRLPGGYKEPYLHADADDTLRNFDHPQLNPGLWKTLAIHTGHHMRVIDEYHADTDTVAGYAKIGAERDVSWKNYLKGWYGVVGKPLELTFLKKLRYACHDCKECIDLGKIVTRDQSTPGYVNTEAEGTATPYKQIDVSRALWKMMGMHIEHQIGVAEEGTPDYEKTESYRMIGGSKPNDISFEKYFHYWPGYSAIKLSVWKHWQTRKHLDDPYKFSV